MADQPIPFTPDNIFQGEDGRWYHDGVDVTDRSLPWRCAAGHRWTATLGERTGTTDPGCPYCRRTAQRN